MSGSVGSHLHVVNRVLAHDPSLMKFLEGFSAQSADFDEDRLIEAIDSSDYSAPDWVEALAEFDRWLRAEGVDARPFSAMLGYIHCCTLISAPAVHLPSLKVIVYQSLTEFGFDAISDSHI